MRKSRNIKELLQLLRDNVREYWMKNESSNGLCLVVSDLHLFGLSSNKINKREETYLLNFIKKTQPNPVKFMGNFFKEGYGWEPGELQPRLEYLDKYLEYSLEELEEILKN